MSEPDDPASRSGAGADRIEAMLADFRTAPVPPPVAAPAPASASAAPRRPRDDAVRPLWQAEGGRAAAPKSPWWQARPVWALVGVLVGMAISQGWQALRQQEQRNQALASVTLPAQAMPSVATDTLGAATGPTSAAQPAPRPAVEQTPVLAAAQRPASAEPLAPAVPVVPAVPVAPAALSVAPPPPAVKAAPRAPVAAPAVKRPAKPDSPSTRCKQLKGAEFQRCLQVQCRKDRYFAHRQCIALYERTAKP